MNIKTRNLIQLCVQAFIFVLILMPTLVIKKYHLQGSDYGYTVSDTEEMSFLNMASDKDVSILGTMIIILMVVSLVLMLLQFIIKNKKSNFILVPIVTVLEFIPIILASHAPSLYTISMNNKYYWSYEWGTLFYVEIGLMIILAVFSIFTFTIIKFDKIKTKFPILNIIK